MLGHAVGRKAQPASFPARGLVGFCSWKVDLVKLANSVYAMGLAALVGLLAGCASMNYDQKLNSISAGIAAGNVKGSLQLLASQTGHLTAASADSSDDLLYHMEAGELKRLNGDIRGSTASWRKADQIVQSWEYQARLDPSRLWGDVGSLVLNDTARRYDGRDYEKVMLNVDLALNHLAANDWDSARIEITKMHERQAVIAEDQAKLLQKAAADAQAKNIKVTSFKELGGYPIETLEAPEVQSLKNSYESAFGNYLAGFIYEAVGDTSLAAPGYRKAAEMRPHVPLLEDALSGLDRRSSGSQQAAPDDVDVLFVVESGLAPPIVSRKFAMVLPIPCRQGYCPDTVSLSWPVIPASGPQRLSGIGIDGNTEPLVLLTSVNAMARRALYDEMPAILTRTAVRVIAKLAAQKAADDAANQANSPLGVFGGLLSMATKVAATVTEVADERTWRTLPDAYLIARKTLKRGTHQIAFDLGGTIRVANVTLAGKYAIVSMRVVGNQLYINSQKEGVVSSLDGAASAAVASR